VTLMTVRHFAQLFPLPLDRLARRKHIQIFSIASFQIAVIPKRVSRPGISPRASRRTGREALASPGSHQVHLRYGSRVCFASSPAPLLVLTLAQLHVEQAIYTVNSFQFTRSTRLILAYPTNGRRSGPDPGFGFDLVFGFGF
jgi:hypothetical protein